ncbi:MAG: type II 3-dehydroquinate dehydratase [Bacteroidota bacterium]
MNILIVNGPNLNMLGRREPSIYGHQTLDDVLEALKNEFPQHSLSHFQSNHEGELVDRLQQAMADGTQGLVINGGALSHYSYALQDALAMLSFPKVEVHISHIFAREPFRHRSVISPACTGMISGLGTQGYHLALHWLGKRLP